MTACFIKDNIMQQQQQKW